MIVQLHHQLNDETSAFCAQRDINNFDEMVLFVSQTKEKYPLPRGAVWMACINGSKFFMKAPITRRST